MLVRLLILVNLNWCIYGIVGLFRSFKSCIILMDASNSKSSKALSAWVDVLNNLRWTEIYRETRKGYKHESCQHKIHYFSSQNCDGANSTVLCVWMRVQLPVSCVCAWLKSSHNIITNLLYHNYRTWLKSLHIKEHVTIIYNDAFIAASIHRYLCYQILVIAAMKCIGEKIISSFI